MSAGTVRERLDFAKGDGLLPAVVQSADDGTVLMVGWMSPEALERTLRAGLVTFYSRSRGRLWTKGETSGHRLEVVEARADCDRDAVLVRARPRGPTCHTGERSCFDAGPRLAPPGGPAEAGSEGAGRAGRGPAETPSRPGGGTGELTRALAALLDTVERRDRERPAGSYTRTLLEAGTARAARKVGEEAVEVALAAVDDPATLAGESADLLYHLVVLWRAAGLDPEEVGRALASRRGRRR